MSDATPDRELIPPELTSQERQLERFPKRLNPDSHAGANLIQAPWEEASMDGEAIFGGLA